MKYTYSKSSVKPDRLVEEIKADARIIAAVKNVVFSSPALDIYFEPSLSPSEQTIVNQIVTSHVAMTAQDYVQVRVLAAMDFGRNMMAEYGAKRVVRGAGLEDTRRAILKLATLQAMVVSGSLYTALDELTRITPDDDVTSADIAEFEAKIRKYLGV